MLEYLMLTLAGCLLGVFTGLVPGVHVNTVCLLGLTLYPRLGLNGVEFGVVMIAMSVTHTFLDFIPAIFIGVPEEETALSVLPTHQLVLKGKALEAVKLTGYGSLLGLVFSVLMVPPALMLLPRVYEKTRGFIVYIIGFAALMLILREKKKAIHAAIVFIVSGYLGYTILHLKSISPTHVLFPVFAGLFGLSNIIYSIKTKPRYIPQEEYAVMKVDREFMSSGLLGSLGGMLVGVLPAMSPSQVGIIMSEVFGGSLHTFLVSVSAINTADAIFSLVSLYTIQNPRSGVTVMMDKLIEVDLNSFILFVGVICLTAPIALHLHIQLGRKAMHLVGSVDYRMMSKTVILVVLALIYLLTGWFGVLISIVSTTIGLLPILAGVSRTHLMGVLLVPTIMFFSGYP
jgi:putative membrane protein